MRKPRPPLFAFALAGAVASATAAADVAAPRQAELLYMLKHDCGSCHGMTLKGGLGPPLLPEALTHIPDDAIADTILEGRHGTPMPPWRPLLSPDEVEWLVGILRNGEGVP